MPTTSFLPSENTTPSVLPHSASTTRRETARFSKSYDVLSQVSPVFLEHQGKNQTTGFVLDTDHPTL